MNGSAGCIDEEGFFVDSIVFALLCAVGIVIVIVWIRVATLRLNKKLKREGREPVPEQEIVNVIDWTRR